MIAPHWDWLDPIHGVGYQACSGIGAILAPFVVAIGFYFKPTRCTQLGCRRRARGVSAAGVPFCALHLPRLTAAEEGRVEPPEDGSA